MSRIGKLPIDLPSGVTVTQDGGIVTVKGKNGELQSKFSDKITITQEGEQLVLTRDSDQKESRALHGLTCASREYGKRRFRRFPEESGDRRRWL